eukprot:scaffold4716_cov109-Isochrysis_galbana.AAC.6
MWRRLLLRIAAGAADTSLSPPDTLQTARRQQVDSSPNCPGRQPASPTPPSPPPPCDCSSSTRAP